MIVNVLGHIMLWSMILWIPAVIVGMVVDDSIGADSDRWTCAATLSAPVIIISCIIILFATGNA